MCLNAPQVIQGSRSQRWRGVNLGGWLLLEPGPSSELFGQEILKAAGPLRCEWELMKALRKRKALSLLQIHRDTYIQKEDFIQIRNMGLNAVRVPFGYWIVLGPSHGDPYEGPALHYLDLAVQWAEECGLEVLLDLHACPGGESPDAPCGRRQRPESKWSWKHWRTEESLKALEVVAKRYGHKPHVTGIAVCNEPSRKIPSEVLCRYYDKAIDVVRSAGVSASQVAVVLPVFQRSVAEFVDVWASVSGGRHENYCFDVHHYHCFGDDWQAKSFAEQLRAVQARAEDFNRFPMVVGEWSLALGARAKQQLPSEEAMSVFGGLQLSVYSQASHGWFFWNWKDGAGLEWDLSRSHKRALMPRVAPSLPSWAGTGQDPLAVELNSATQEDLQVRFGHAVYLRAHNGRCIDVDRSQAAARWCDRGDWQSFVVCPVASSSRAGIVKMGQPVRDGDTVRLLAHTGSCLTVTKAGKVTTPKQGGNNDLVVCKKKENPSDSPSLQHGDRFCLQCRSSKRVIEVEGTKVAARFEDFGQWQTLSVERADVESAVPGRFLERSAEEADWQGQVRQSVGEEACEAVLTTPERRKRPAEDLAPYGVTPEKTMVRRLSWGCSEKKRRLSGSLLLQLWSATSDICL